MVDVRGDVLRPQHGETYSAKTLTRKESHFSDDSDNQSTNVSTMAMQSLIFDSYSIVPLVPSTNKKCSFLFVQRMNALNVDLFLLFANVYE